MRWLIAVDEATSIAILGGATTAILRRRRPLGLRTGDDVYLYATTLERIVGRFAVEDVPADSVGAIARRWHRRAGVSMTAAFGLLSGCRAPAAVLVAAAVQIEPVAIPPDLPHPEDGLLPIVDPEIEQLLNRAEEAMHA